MVASPSKMPLVKYGRSLSPTVPSPTGMVNTTVQPKMADTIMPANFPNAASCAKSMAIW